MANQINIESIMKPSIFFILMLFNCSFDLISQQYPAELMKQDTEIKIINGIKKTINHLEIKINNREGQKHSVVEIHFSKLVKLKNIRAHLLDKNGNIIRTLKKSDIRQRSELQSFSFYEDSFVKEFDLKHNVYPYTLVYSYETEEKEFLQIANWFPILNLRIPTHLARLTVITTPEYGIKYKSNRSEKFTSTQVKNFIHYNWSTSYFDFVIPQNKAPDISRLLPFVKVVPMDFKFEKEGSLKDWVSFGNWYDSILEDKNELSAYDIEKITELTKDLKSDYDKIKTVYNYVQDNTRYTYISLETGGLIPWPAKYVSENKYGDCKALGNYFKAMMDHLGIKAHYCTVYAGGPVKNLDEDFISQQANHIIVYIPHINDGIWLDMTSKFAFNYLGTFTQNRSVHVIDKDNSYILKTPALTSEDVLTTRNFTIKHLDKTAHMEARYICRGEYYERVFEIDKRFNERDKLVHITSFISMPNVKVNDFQVSGIDRNFPQLALEFKAESNSLYRTHGQEILAGNIPFESWLLEKPDKRIMDMIIEYPLSLIDTIEYIIPDECLISFVNPGIVLKSEFGTYAYDITHSADKILIIKSLYIKDGLIPLNKYNDFYDFHKNVVSHENGVNFILNKK